MNIFSKADRSQLQALARCAQPEMAPLLQLFENVRQETMHSLVYADEVEHTRRMQYRVRVIEDFLQAVREAPTVLERVTPHL